MKKDIRDEHARLLPTTPASARRLRTALRAGAADGTYLCIVFVDKDGKTGTVCEKVR